MLLQAIQRRALSGVIPRSRKAMTCRADTGKYTLIDVPVSNNGARARWVIKKKGLENSVEIQPPSVLGGLKTPEYLALNPQGKMPILIMPGGKSALPESEVIVQFLLDKFNGQGPSLVASTPEARALGHLATRIVDVYISPIQGCMYRPMDSPQARAEGVAAINQQLDALEMTIKDSARPFICGTEMTCADAALFPTCVFFNHILPKHFGWTDVFANRPTLAAWWSAVQQDKEAREIIQEIQDGLNQWEQNNRWEANGIDGQVAANPQIKWAYP